MAETTTKFKLTKPSLDDNISPEQFNENFDIIDDTLAKIVLKSESIAARVAALENDTGWIDCTLASNMMVTSSTVRYRRCRNIVQIKGTFNPETFNEITQHYGNCYTIPSDMKPQSVVYGVCYYGDINTGIIAAACNVSEDGIISIFLDSNTTLADIIGKSVRINIVYLIDMEE